MTSSQYLRQFSAIVADAEGNGLDLSDFRCVFRSHRGDFEEPNTLDLRVYNLSNATANLIQGEFSQIVVQAGYAGSYGQIFGGTVKQVRKGRENATDSYVEISAADGDEAYNFATMALSMAAGSYPTDTVQQLVSSLVAGSINQQLTPPTVVPGLPTAGRVRGRVYYGRTRNALRAFCKTYGLSWSIQDGKITLIPLTGYLPGPVPLISPDSGLVGVPEQTQSGIELTTLLNPNIKIGQLIQLDSKAINLLAYGLSPAQTPSNLALQAQIKTNADGKYYVMVATHQGDTRGQPWYTHVVCLSTDAAITQAPPSNALPEGAVAAYGLG